MKITIQEFIEKFTNAVDFQNPVEIKPETLIHELPEWDSLAALGVIVMFDIELEKTISGSDIKKCQSITDLYMISH